MSNNIYNILGKLKSITDTAALTPDTQPTTVYESVEARGSITEAVKSLEAKYQTFKEGSNSYPTDANWDKSGQMDPLAKGTGPSRTRANPKSTARDIEQANFQTKKAIKGRLGKVEESKDSKPSRSEFKKEVDYFQALSYFYADVAEKSSGQKRKEADGLSAKYQGKVEDLNESVADDIADKKAEKEAGDWWGDKKASLNKDKREVKGDKYGGSKQKDDEDDDFKSKKTAILDKDEEELDESVTADGGEITKKGIVTTHKGKKYGGEEEFPNRGKSAKDIMDRKNPYRIVDLGDAPDEELDESFEFGSKNFKNASNLKKAPKAKLVKESASVRNHPIYTNPEAWDHYKKELDEEELGKATQELDEISKLAGLPKPAANTVPPIAPAPVADNNWDDAAWDDESGYDLDDPKHPTWLDRQHDAADLQNDYNKENPAVPAIDESNELDDERDQLQHLMNKYNWSYAEAVEHLNYDEWDPADWVDTRFEEVVDEAEMEEGNEFSGALASAKAAGIKDFEVAGKKYTVKEDINVNVTASGEEDALNLFRKLAGMPLAAVAPQEEPLEVEIDEEFANSPHEHIAPVSAAIPSGNDLHGAKRAYKIAATGDNPMAVAEAKDTSWSKYTGMLKGLLK